MNISPDVIIDLWPLYVAGEASAATRALVDEFLAQNPEFASRLRDDDASKLLTPAPLSLEPDHELKTFVQTRQALYKRQWPLFFAILFSCSAFGRIISDTSWDVSPRNFAITAAIAVGFWIWFIVRLARGLVALR
jgi:anti-sigma factor RsiW